MSILPQFSDVATINLDNIFVEIIPGFSTSGNFSLQKSKVTTIKAKTHFEPKFSVLPFLALEPIEGRLNGNREIQTRHVKISNNQTKFTNKCEYGSYEFEEWCLLTFDSAYPAFDFLAQWQVLSEKDCSQLDLMEMPSKSLNQLDAIINRCRVLKEIGLEKYSAIVLPTNSLTEKDSTLVKGYIYVFQCLDTVKFGFSESPDDRLLQIQTGNPYPVTKLKQMKGTLKQEQAFHLRNKHHSIRGEWYPVSLLSSLLEDLKTYCD